MYRVFNVAVLAFLVAFCSTPVSAQSNPLVEQIDVKRMVIAAQRRINIEELKAEPGLNTDQLKWLVEIEDLLVEVDDIYARAKTMLILGVGAR